MRSGGSIGCQAGCPLAPSALTGARRRPMRWGKDALRSSSVARREVRVRAATSSRPLSSTTRESGICPRARPRSRRRADTACARARRRTRGRAPGRRPPRRLAIGQRAAYAPRSPRLASARRSEIPMAPPTALQREQHTQTIRDRRRISIDLTRRATRASVALVRSQRRRQLEVATPVRGRTAACPCARRGRSHLARARDQRGVTSP